MCVCVLIPFSRQASDLMNMRTILCIQPSDRRGLGVKNVELPCTMASCERSGPRGWSWNDKDTVREESMGTYAECPRGLSGLKISRVSTSIEDIEVL